MKQSLDRRLRRFEPAHARIVARKKAAFRSRRDSIRRLSFSGETEYAAKPFFKWFDNKFWEIQTSNRIINFYRCNIGREKLFTIYAWKEFRAWWKENLLDRPLPDGGDETFSFLVDDLQTQMYYEAIGGLVPVDKRHYFIDPDRWIIAHRRDAATGEDDPAPLFFFRLLIRPTGATLRRAELFAEAWAELPLEERTIQPWTPVGDHERPLAWLRRTLAERSDAPAA